MLLAACVALPSWAALTDVSQQPLITTSQVPIPPNLLFILDDSGSMAETYLPEAVVTGTSTTGGATQINQDRHNFRYGRASIQCNGLAYDPKGVYDLPLNADGTERAPGATSTAFNANVELTNIRFPTPTALVDVKVGSSLVFNMAVTAPKAGRPINEEWNKGPVKWYGVGFPVTVYDDNNKTRWLIATVESWLPAVDYKTGNLTIKVLDISATDVDIGKVRLGDGFPPFVYFDYKGTEPRLNYTYDGKGVPLANTFMKECAGFVNDAAVKDKWSAPMVVKNVTEVVDGKTVPTAATQHFANWFHYYQNRMKMMKTVVTRAFRTIDTKFRVGFSVISAMTPGATDSADFVHMREFNDAQRTAFYNAVWNTPPSGTTPLRAALSVAGRYYANAFKGDNTPDPVQYSCQRNYALLSTDGAWNTQMEDATEKFGPYQIDGVTAIGQQDGTADRPMRDATGGGGTGGQSNTLADVAMYYYLTDLRTEKLGNCTGALGKDVCTNSVPPAGDDIATHQHLTTFSLSLGQNGTIPYQKGYKKYAPGDGSSYDKLVRGDVNWPNPFTGAGDINNTTAVKIDDLWHAAVNGRGEFFNGSDASSVAEGITNALAQIQGIEARGSAGATSTLRPVAGNNSVFIASYKSEVWTGDLRAYDLDLGTGAVVYQKADGSDAKLWSAHERLAAAASRSLLYEKGGVMRPFTYTNLTADGYGADFDNKASGFTHYATLTAEEKTAANSGANLVDFIAGKALSYYRNRDSKLADIVNGAPVYDGPLSASYKDDGYAAFVAASRKNRPAVVYVGSNGGFLHAFDAKTGDELWAFMPSEVRSRLHKLADKNYGQSHLYFVDGPSALADVNIGGGWKTVLVFGLGAGGRSYTALDVTDPKEPKFLWEFTNTNLGTTHARPLITKRKDGTWVAAVPSGFNNVGDGQGRLFLINMATGKLVTDLPNGIATGVGDATTPAGLGPLNSWVESLEDHTSVRYYAGDNLGNLWRFDTEGLVEPYKKAQLVASFKVDGVAQPITTAPTVAEVDYKGFKSAVVFVGTGRMVGKSDIDNSDQQSIYAVRDTLTATGWGDVRGGGHLVQQEVTADGETRRNTSDNPVDWGTKAGWVVDLLEEKERINIPMDLYGNTLVAAANVPITLATCGAGSNGHAWLYALDIANGKGKIEKIVTSQVVGITILQTPSGIVANVTGATGDPPPPPLPQPSKYEKQAKRANWRTLAGQ